MGDTDLQKELEKAALLKNFKNRLDNLTEEFEVFKEESVTKDELATYFTKDVKITSVTVEDQYITFKLSDDRLISIPVWWSTKLDEAEDLSGFEVAEGRKKVKWPEVNEEITLYGILQGAPASE